MQAVYNFKFKHRWAIKNHVLSGITIGPWLKILREHGSDIDWFTYAHRVIFLTILALFNTLFAVADWLRFRKAIAATELNPEPIFVLGHPRSGTTHIQNLLALDPNLASCNTFQAGFPSAFLSFERHKHYIAGIIDNRRPMDNMALSFNTPAEDEIAINILSGGVSPYMSLMFMHKHRHFSKYLSFEDASPEELQAWCDAFLWFLKKVTLAHGGNSSNGSSSRPLVIKSPVHMGRIKLFQKMFPRARYVFVHRDPVEVFQSSAHMADTYFWYCALHRPSDQFTTDYIIEQHNQLYAAYLKDRGSIPTRNLIELPFADIDGNPLAALQRIYHRFNLTNFEETKPVFEKYLDQLDGFKKNDHKGLLPRLRSRVEKEWSGVAAEFGYRHMTT